MRDVAIVSDHVTGESAVAVVSLIHDALRLVLNFSYTMAPQVMQGVYDYKCDLVSGKLFSQTSILTTRHSRKSQKLTVLPK